MMVMQDLGQCCVFGFIGGKWGVGIGDRFGQFDLVGVGFQLVGCRCGGQVGGQNVVDV